MAMKRDTDAALCARLHVVDELRATANDVRADTSRAREAARRTIAEAKALRDRVAQDCLWRRLWTPRPGRG
jgi:hypothetical protein